MLALYPLNLFHSDDDESCDEGGYAEGGYAEGGYAEGGCADGDSSCDDYDNMIVVMVMIIGCCDNDSSCGDDNDADAADNNVNIKTTTSFTRA
jgi:hypothetical protein